MKLIKMKLIKNKLKVKCTDCFVVWFNAEIEIGMPSSVQPNVGCIVGGLTTPWKLVFH